MLLCHYNKIKIKILNNLSCPVSSVCLVIRFRVSPPFFPLLSLTTTSQRLSFHPRVADTTPSFNTLLYSLTHTRVSTSPHLLVWKWKFIRPPSPILADLVMLAILPLLLTFPPTPKPILTNSPHSSHPTTTATQNLTSHLLPLTQKLYKSLPSLL